MNDRLENRLARHLRVEPGAKVLSFIVAQYVAHAAAGYFASQRRQRPERLLLYGRF